MICPRQKSMAETWLLQFPSLCLGHCHPPLLQVCPATHGLVCKLDQDSPPVQYFLALDPPHVPHTACTVVGLAMHMARGVGTGHVLPSVCGLSLALQAAQGVNLGCCIQPFPQPPRPMPALSVTCSESRGRCMLHIVGQAG